MLRYSIEPIVPYRQIIAGVGQRCGQILKERMSSNLKVMEQRLNAYLLLAFLCGGELPEMGWSEHGKPYFTAGDRHCSLSHTDTGAAAVISDVSVGIDLQTVIPFTQVRSERVCRDSEKVYCQWEISQKQSNLRFTRVWTAKEAVSKALGTGLGKLSFKDIRVDPERGHGTANGEHFRLIYPQTPLKNMVCCIALKQE